MTQPVIQMQSIAKSFGATRALDGVDFELRPGEVHALIGENGAGKSTLMKLMAGSFHHYTGRIQIRGREASIRSPAAAKQHGIGMVYQEGSLARPISIAENLLVGRLPRRFGLFVHRAELQHESRRLLEAVGLRVDPRKTVAQISQHEAQLVEIAKVLGNQPDVLVMDEPSAVLSREEVQRLFTIIRRLRDNGMAIVYISHHLSEIFGIADRVTVLRDGRRIDTCPIADTTPQRLVQMMVGQPIDKFYHHREARIGKTSLRVRRLTRYGFFHDVSFDARSGEILGIVGLTGGGRTELARSVCGLDPVHEGAVELNGQLLARASYAEAVARGLVYLTENRKNDGLFLRLSVTHNLVAALIRRHTRMGIYSSRHEAGTTRRLIEQLQVGTASANTRVANLSGGNQQKVLLGKWLATQPRVLILDEPTRGVDVRAKQKIHQAIMELANRGAAILLISSDLPELVALADRAVVVRNGHLIDEIQRAQMSEESVLLAANGEGL